LGAFHRRFTAQRGLFNVLRPECARFANLQGRPLLPLLCKIPGLAPTFTGKPRDFHYEESCVFLPEGAAMVGTSELRKGAPLITVGGKEIIVPLAGIAAGAGDAVRTEADMAISIEPGAAIEQRSRKQVGRRACWLPIRDETRLLIAGLVIAGLVVALGVLGGVRLKRKG
jgi:hypothetical protein